MYNEGQPIRRLWPELPKAQELDLIRLMHVLQRSPDNPVTWTETTERIVYEGPWQEQAFRKVEVTRELDFGEKQRLIQTTIARLYQGLTGTPAEQKARDIIRRSSNLSY